MPWGQHSPEASIWIAASSMGNERRGPGSKFQPGGASAQNSKRIIAAPSTTTMATYSAQSLIGQPGAEPISARHISSAFARITFLAAAQGSYGPGETASAWSDLQAKLCGHRCGSRLMNTLTVVKRPRD
jgi:hypothetical protein